MNWLSNFARPGLSKKKPEDARDTPDNLWIKDPLSGDLIYRAELEQADWVTPSGFHMRIGPEPRFKQMFDEQAWQTITLPKVALPIPRGNTHASRVRAFDIVRAAREPGLETPTKSSVPSK